MDMNKIGRVLQSTNTIMGYLIQERTQSFKFITTMLRCFTTLKLPNPFIFLSLLLLATLTFAIAPS